MNLIKTQISLLNVLPGEDKGGRSSLDENVAHLWIKKHKNNPPKNPFPKELAFLGFLRGVL